MKFKSYVLPYAVLIVGYYIVTFLCGVFIGRFGQLSIFTGIFTGGFLLGIAALPYMLASIFAEIPLNKNPDHCTSYKVFSVITILVICYFSIGMFTYTPWYIYVPYLAQIPFAIMHFKEKIAESKRTQRRDADSTVKE